LPLLDFLGAIRKSTERFTRIHWLNPRRIGEQERAGRFRSGGLKARTDLNSKNTKKANRPLPIVQNMAFFKTFLFSKITFWKKKILTFLINYLLTPNFGTCQGKMLQRRKGSAPYDRWI
jgi:hypothetical protein